MPPRIARRRSVNLATETVEARTGGTCEPLFDIKRPPVVDDGCARSNGLHEAELGERRDAVVETDLLDDLAVLDDAGPWCR
mgnify:CR=1 FL=1